MLDVKTPTDAYNSCPENYPLSGGDSAGWRSVRAQDVVAVASSEYDANSRCIGGAGGGGGGGGAGVAVPGAHDETLASAEAADTRQIAAWGIEQEHGHDMVLQDAEDDRGLCTNSVQNASKVRAQNASEKSNAEAERGLERESEGEKKSGKISVKESSSPPPQEQSPSIIYNAKLEAIDGGLAAAARASAHTHTHTHTHTHKTRRGFYSQIGRERGSAHKSSSSSHGQNIWGARREAQILQSTL